MAKRVRSLDPIIDKNSRVLILGTMPGPESLRRNQYYANPGNQFWRIVYRVLDESEEPPSEYEQKIEFIRENGIALWDVLKSCERNGASVTLYDSGAGRFWKPAEVGAFSLSLFLVLCNRSIFNPGNCSHNLSGTVGTILYMRRAKAC